MIEIRDEDIKCYFNELITPWMDTVDVPVTDMDASIWTLSRFITTVYNMVTFQLRGSDTGVATLLGPVTPPGFASTVRFLSHTLGQARKSLSAAGCRYHGLVSNKHALQEIIGGHGDGDGIKFALHLSHRFSMDKATSEMANYMQLIVTCNQVMPVVVAAPGKGRYRQRVVPASVIDDIKDTYITRSHHVGLLAFVPRVALVAALEKGDDGVQKGINGIWDVLLSMSSTQQARTQCTPVYVNRHGTVHMNLDFLFKDMERIVQHPTALYPDDMGYVYKAYAPPSKSRVKPADMTITTKDESKHIAPRMVEEIPDKIVDIDNLLKMFSDYMYHTISIPSDTDTTADKVKILRALEIKEMERSASGTNSTPTVSIVVAAAAATESKSMVMKQRKRRTPLEYYQEELDRLCTVVLVGETKLYDELKMKQRVSASAERADLYTPLLKSRAEYIHTNVKSKIQTMQQQLQVLDAAKSNGNHVEEEKLMEGIRKWSEEYKDNDAEYVRRDHKLLLGDVLASPAWAFDAVAERSSSALVEEYNTRLRIHDAIIRDRKTLFCYSTSEQQPVMISRQNSLYNVADSSTYTVVMRYTSCPFVDMVQVDKVIPTFIAVKTSPEILPSQASIDASKNSLA